MKKAILVLITIFCINSGVFAQQLEHDVTYYKVLNKLWTMSGSFDKVAFHLGNSSVELAKTRDQELQVIEKLHVGLLQEFETLMSKNYQDHRLDKLGKMVEAMEISIADLKNEKWRSDDMWQFGYNLVKQDLGELETQTATKGHLSKVK